jgi:hypothetical protein
MSKIAKIFGGGKPKVDTSGIKRQERLLKQQEEKLEQEEEMRKRKEASAAAARRGRTGAGSLLSGLETGVDPVESGNRTTLG